MQGIVKEIKQRVRSKNQVIIGVPDSYLTPIVREDLGLIYLSKIQTMFLDAFPSISADNNKRGIR